MNQKNYYEILQVAESATEAEIKQAYRKLAKEYHPDRHPDDISAESKFKEIGEAYEVLKDTEKRRKYDELRRYGAGQPPPGNMSYEDFINRFGGYRGRGGEQEEFTWGFGGGLDDIFSQLFGGAGNRSRRPSQRSRSYHFDFGGAKSNSEAMHPEATHDAFFKRKGDDAYVDIPINLGQALLGSTIRVRTPQGKRVNVKIVPGTQPEAVLRVRGMGFNDRGQGGDLYIRTHLTIPVNLTEEQKTKAAALLRELGMRF
ncbi:MAG: J domain-containing protein [Bacteroidetes bacterium]|nr:J domain-containing protein [Bacteroidota bacterium]